MRTKMPRIRLESRQVALIEESDRTRITISIFSSTLRTAFQIYVIRVPMLPVWLNRCICIFDSHVDRI
jgi:hypothetical protein